MRWETVDDEVQVETPGPRDEAQAQRPRDEAQAQRPRDEVETPGPRDMYRALRSRNNPYRHDPNLDNPAVDVTPEYLRDFRRSLARNELRIMFQGKWRSLAGIYIRWVIPTSPMAYGLYKLFVSTEPASAPSKMVFVPNILFWALGWIVGLCGWWMIKNLFQWYIRKPVGLLFTALTGWDLYRYSKMLDKLK